MPVAINDILRISWKMLLENAALVNVFHFKVSANATADDSAFMDEMVAYLESVYSNIDQLQTDNLTYDGIEGQNITQDTILPPKDVPILVGGTSIADPLPNPVACYVYFPTLRLRTRASTYIPGLTVDGLQSAGAWNGTVKAAVDLFGDDFIGFVGTVNITMQRGAYNKPLNRFNPVISRITKPRARTQRRRRPGVGS